MTTPFAETVRNHADDLTPSEQRLVSSVLNEPRAAALGTALDLARGAGVHEATVSRLARKLGFGGYSAFRQALQREFIASEETATRLERTIAASREDGVLGSLVTRELSALAALPGHVSEAEIAEAAGRLMAARRIYVFATGNAEVLARLMHRRFRRFGREVHLLWGDARNLAEGVLAMGAEDQLLICAFRRAPRAYAPLIERARAVGAGTIVISGVSGNMMSPAPDLLLSAPRGGDAAGFQTLTVPMAIANAIVIAAGAVGDISGMEALDDLGDLIRRLE